jgi:hypothetical protein
VSNCALDYGEATLMDIEYQTKSELIPFLLAVEAHFEVARRYKAPKLYTPFIFSTLQQLIILGVFKDVFKLHSLCDTDLWDDVKYRLERALKEVVVGYDKAL